jgi:hypothetical protein
VKRWELNNIPWPLFTYAISVFVFPPSDFNDLEYRENYAQNPEDGKLPYLIPPFLIWLVLLACIAGTAMWFILASDGAIITPLLRILGIDKISMGLTLFLCVIVEGTSRL